MIHEIYDGHISTQKELGIRREYEIEKRRIFENLTSAILISIIDCGQISDRCIQSITCF